MAVVAVLAQLAIEMPGEYFGSGFDVALAGTAFSVVVIVLALVVAVLDAAGSPRARFLASMTLVLVVGVFLWPLAVDPLVAGAVIGWALYSFGRMLFDVDVRKAVIFDDLPTTPSHAWLHEHGPAARHLLGVSVVCGVCVVGYGFERTFPAFALTVGFALLAIASTFPLVVDGLRRRRWTAFVVVVLAAAGLLTLGVPRLSLTLLLFTQLSLLLAARHERLTRDLLEGLYERPAALVTTSFIALILVGTLLLSFPGASSSGISIGVVDALFTATSAACVTGLIVLDTAADFSRFGQAIILLLVQIGGLNIMVLSTFAALLLGRGLGLRGEKALGDVLSIDTPGAAYRLIGFIIKVTIGLELIGAAGMAAAFYAHGYSLGLAGWNGLFHAISAFCNAGFALQSDSLVMFQRSPLPLLLMAVLITLGGIGFAVLGSFWTGVRDRELGRFALQSRIVLLASAVLVVIGTAAFLSGEWNGSLAGLSMTGKLSNALFQSVTLRTAGFNSVSFDGLQPVSALWMLAFMFIGASPGGTGGGIKTTTAVVLFAAIPAFLRRRSHVVLQGRSISAQVLHQCASIAVASVTVVLFGALLLMASQAMPFESLLFEAFSAFGTVGLSLGATARLDAFGKAVVILVMLIGRVGPLAITLLLARDYPSRVTYPEARLMVG